MNARGTTLTRPDKPRTRQKGHRNNSDPTMRAAANNIDPWLARYERAGLR